MRTIFLPKQIKLIAGLFLCQISSTVFAGDLGINVILAGELQPGVYGQVEIGNSPRPAVVYEQPRVIVVEKRYANAQPIYLHVPPGHAKHWDKHCGEYQACNRPVYFVKSEEYEPGYVYHDDHDHNDDRDEDRGHHDNGHGNGKHKGRH